MVHRLGVCVVVMAVLVGCGTTAASAPAPTALPPTPIIIVVTATVGITPTVPMATPEEVADQFVKAMDQRDVVTLQTLIDDSVSLKDVMIRDFLRQWQTQATHNLDHTDYLGPLQSTTVQPAHQAGASTLVTVLLHQQDGEGKLDLTLRQTPTGWRAMVFDLHEISQGDRMLP